jgi:alpha-glucosidase
MFARSGGRVQGRDGCRVPLPWSGTAQPFGFGPSRSDPWLPQPASWAALTAEAQAGDPDSMLALYREALWVRRSHPGFAEEGLRWRDAPAGVLRFQRGGRTEVIVNLGREAIALPADARILVASARDATTHLPPDAAAWLELPPD